jgi:His-Xaa-Ser system protein HxsD
MSDDSQDQEIHLRISHDLVSSAALLKTCYWFSREYVCEVQDEGPGHSIISLKPKLPSGSPQEIKDSFMSQAMDFALRERVTADTASVRDLILAKAFSESGILEDDPQGVFGDLIEEENTDGMFKILSNR